MSISYVSGTSLTIKCEWESHNNIFLNADSAALYLHIGRFAIAICSNYCQEACFQVLDTKTKMLLPLILLFPVSFFAQIFFTLFALGGKFT